MRKYKLILFLLLYCITGLSQDFDYAKFIIGKLSSPEFKGRGYVENGDKLSADFIATEFRNLGLNSVMGKSFFQEFNVSVNTLPDRATVKINSEELIAGIDYIIESSSPSVNGKYQIFKVTRSELDTEDKLLSIVKKAGNSVILIDNRDRKNEKPEIAKGIDEFVNFLKYSPQAKSKGIIIYTNDKLTWEESPEQGMRPVITLVKELDIESINSVELVIDAKFIPAYETRNVMGSLKGTSETDSMIVVLAHYDHLGKMGRDTYFPGANDNASGVAMILNLAKYYSANKPEYTMVFVALGAEELGLLGAKAFTDNPPVDLKKIKFLVNFDLAGTGDEGIKVVNGSVFRNKFDLLTRINDEKKLLPKVDIRGPACNSDHCLFYQKGVPCFYIYTLGGIQAYHDVSDKSDTLPLTEFVDFCSLIIEFFDRM